MLTVLSPAKTLDFETPSTAPKHSQPLLLDESEKLIDILTTKSPHDLQKMMGISDTLAALNVERFHEWRRPFNKGNAKTAVLAFRGDVYVGLEADSFSDEDFAFAQDHLRILSGLYGVLRPLDLMQAYRLEMGIKLDNPNGSNLYQFWGSKITDLLNKHIKKSGSTTLLNLASNEYFKAIKKKELNAEVISPAFRHYRDGNYKMISFFAKRARGTMAAWVTKNKINSVDDLKEFNLDGYRYNKTLSTESAPVFTARR